MPVTPKLSYIVMVNSSFIRLKRLASGSVPDPLQGADGRPDMACSVCVTMTPWKKGDESLAALCVIGRLVCMYT
jgi:hypothetical protein